MTQDGSLRNQLVAVLKGDHSHDPMHQVIAAWPVPSRSVKLGDANHTAWEILEHLRIAQWDILSFSLSADHVSPKFPDGYWPDTAQRRSMGSERWTVCE